MCFAADLCLLLALLCTGWPPRAAAQDLQEQDALCNAEGCYSVYFQRKTFRDSWKSCKEKGGNLATVKRPEEAALIRELLSAGERRSPRVRVRLWIGLQRQPRQCSATRPLRGFTWITGDQDTQYTNWQREGLPTACAAPRCVVMTHNTTDKSRSDRDNFKWLEGSCSLPVDGFLCRYTYRGMCPALQSEGGGPALYTTPFKLLSTLLTHIPFGSVATLPCPDGAKGDQSVLCMLREDGGVGWSKDAPLCSDAPMDWCERDNGGCEHYCVNADSHYYCECSEDFQLGEDGQSCQPTDSCHTADCEFACEPTPGGFRCLCPEGHLLAPDGQSCLDVDECLQNPCPQLCVNAPGTFECRCSEGYRDDEFGECVDVDECKEGSCEHACENSPGSYACHCRQGFSQLPEDPSRCQDTDECQMPGTCEQICQNYMGGFECHCEEGYELQDHYTCLSIPEDTEYSTTVIPSDPTSLSWDPQFPGFPWSARLPDWVTDATVLEWLTERPSLEWLPTDLGWFTEMPQEEASTTQAPDWINPTSPNSPSSNWLEDDTTSSTPTYSQDGGKVRLWVSDSEISAAPDDIVQGGGTISRVQVSDIDSGTIESTSVSPSASSYPPNAREAVTVIAKEAGDEVILSPAPPHTPKAAIPSASGTEQRPGSGKRRHDKSWLLVALLVPLCVFMVVMLALGIVYCTSCAVAPRNKSVTDCYRWTTTSKSGESNTAKSRA